MKPSSWTAQELTSKEEAANTQLIAKADRQAALQAKRQAKIDTQVAKYQKRIDSLHKNGKTTSLADIWESAQRKLRELSKYTLTQREALDLVDREAVWAHYGLGGLSQDPLQRAA